MCLGLIGIIMSLPFVVAPPPTSKYPYLYYTYKGEYVDGDLDSFKEMDDGNVISWQGLYYLIIWPISAWLLEVGIFFERPGGSYETVGLEINFKYTGSSDLTIVVYYHQGGPDTFYVSTTGGYLHKSYPLDAYKTVQAVHFETWHFFDRQYLYIDFLRVGYIP